MSVFDITIVGGGLAGASLATALQGYPGRVAMVEARPPEVLQQDTFDQRSIALADVSRRIFDTLGVWDGMAAQAQPIREIRVSEKGAFGATYIRAEREGLDALAWVVPHRVLGQVLHDKLQDIKIFSPASATRLTQYEDHVAVTLDRAGVCEELQTRLLILADSGGLREAAGFDAEVTDYEQVAVVVNMETEVASDAVAYERFTSHGPLAVLPLGGTRCAVVWTQAKDKVDAVAALPDADFIAALQSDFGYRLGRIRRVGARSMFPLRLAQTRQMVNGRIAVIGNAAHTLHPVAGQNFNLTLRDVAALAESVFDEEDVGAARHLAVWQACRRADVARVAGFTDFLVRAFASRMSLFAPLRGAALLGLELFPPLRRAVVRRSLGLLPPASRLASGLSLRSPLKPSLKSGGEESHVA